MKAGKLYRPNKDMILGARKLPLTDNNRMPPVFLDSDMVFMYIGPLGDDGHRFLWEDNLLYIIGKLANCCHQVGKQQ